MNARQFTIALAAYFTAGWTLGEAFNTAGAYAFLLLFGGATFAALKGGVAIRLTLVALLAPAAHVGLVPVLGYFDAGQTIDEAALLLLGAALGGPLIGFVGRVRRSSSVLDGQRGGPVECRAAGI